MKLKKILAVSLILSSTLFASGDIAPVEPMVEEVPVAASAWSYELEPYMLIASMN